ncbi:MAG: M67 family metallopeptidase [Erythrobacter sp.]|nr:M67 family metallopeptidase [Erythrobacter sp.]
MIAPAALAAIRAHAAAAHPHECCGILLGHQADEGTRIAEARAARNVHPAPQTHFEIDPQALINAHRAARDGKAQVIGYYHSHPRGPAEPSALDSALAAGDGLVWAIHGAGDGADQEGGEIRFWCSLPGGFDALSCAIVED